MNLIVRLIDGALSFWTASSLIDNVVAYGGTFSYFLGALNFDLINTLIGLLIKLITQTRILLSLFLFALVMNKAMLILTQNWRDLLNLNNFRLIISISIIILTITILIGNRKNLQRKLKIT